MATEGGSRSWPTVQPLVELHWKHSATRYGFCGAEGMQRHWGTSCIEEFNVSNSDTNHVIMLTSENGRRRQIPYCNVVDLVAAVGAGYDVKERQLAFRRQGVGVVKMELQESKSSQSAFMLVCLDLQRDVVLGSFQMSDTDGQANLHHVEIFDLARSKDGQVLALSVGLMRNGHFLFEAVENVLILYDTKSMKELCRLRNPGHVISAAAFDPRFGHCHFAVAGGYDNQSGRRSLSLYSLHRPTPIKSVSIEELLDEEGESHLEVSYSKGGTYIILQVLEPLGYSKEWMYTTYLYDADTLDKLVRYKPSLMRSCHPPCQPTALPLLSHCGSYIALANNSGKQGEDFHIRVYRLPCKLDLMAQCRTAILRAVVPPGGNNNIHHLPLPNILIEFLTWKRSEFICTEEHIEDEGNREVGEGKCICNAGKGDVIIKDASWYTGNNDVPTDPDREAAMLHRRARNEVYS